MWGVLRSLGMVLGMVTSVSAFTMTEPMIAADPLVARVHRGQIAYVHVAVGLDAQQDVIPIVSGIVYDARGRMRSLRHKALHADWTQVLAWEIRPTDPVGRWTLHTTIERDTHAYGFPLTLEVVP